MKTGHRAGRKVVFCCCCRSCRQVNRHRHRHESSHLHRCSPPLPRWPSLITWLCSSCRCCCFAAMTRKMTLDNTGTCVVCPGGECPPGPRFGSAFQIHSFASAGLYIHTHTRTQHAEEKEATTNAQMRQFNSIVFFQF